MERLLLLWDDLDDVTNAVRHVVGSALGEAAAVAGPVATVATALVGFLLGIAPRT